MYIFSWGYSPLSFFNILYLAGDSLLKHLCCYFLLFLGRLLASLLSVCKNSIKTPPYSMENIKSFQMIFFGIGIASYFLTLFKLTSCKKLQLLLSQSVTCPNHMSELHFFHSPAQTTFHRRSDEISGIASKIFWIILKIFTKCLQIFIAVYQNSLLH